ncbi:MAG: helix-turn-helix domain-containing protein [Oscillospiraceae bacterium]|nr:helix-turn-helix domain-containing protein [Oscillospiraceae bacterium]
MHEKFITAQQAAKKWNISDRRVRVLCRENRIPGAVKAGKSYKIPADALKPIDGRKSSVGEASRFLKWDNDVIGTIDNANAVAFARPGYNEVVALYTRGAKSWTPEQFTEFLSERVVSQDRRDIERILFRCGLSHYDVQRIAEITRGIHPKDLLWVANDENERFEDIITDVFDSVFHQKIDLTGDSLNTPEGYNIKRYGVYNGQYGIYKQRISPFHPDVESEVAVYLLAQKLGIPCCPAYRADKDTVFSAFLYDFATEYVVHFRRLFSGARSGNEYQNLIAVRPQYRDDIARMILLDFITRQDDRHLSNIAIKVTNAGESFYPLYDNGRSLFYEDTEETVRQAIADPEKYATTFGYTGTYWDTVREIAEERGGLNGLINLDIPKDEIAGILREADFKRYRFDGALEWIIKAMEMINQLD